MTFVKIKLDELKPTQALCFDLIAPIAGEICGGSLREDNYEILKQRISSFQKPEALDWLVGSFFGNETSVCTCIKITVSQSNVFSSVRCVNFLP